MSTESDVEEDVDVDDLFPHLCGLTLPSHPMGIGGQPDCTHARDKSRIKRPRSIVRVAIPRSQYQRMIFISRMKEQIKKKEYSRQIAAWSGAWIFFLFGRDSSFKQKMPVFSGWLDWLRVSIPGAGEGIALYSSFQNKSSKDYRKRLSQDFFLSSSLERFWLQ